MLANNANHVRAPGVREHGGILLVSCYELGHQPLSLASPAAALTRAGFSPDVMDISVESFAEDKVSRARVAGISVPMHTALRLGIEVARRIRRINPRCHICFYGLYAALNAEYLLESVADSCFGGEFEHPLVALAETLERNEDPPDVSREYEMARRSKKHASAPRRGLLPPLGRYVKREYDGRVDDVGYVATTRGCRHLCRHCPIPPVYDGKFYALPVSAVLDDIRQLVSMGARHITFADPDFLNGPTHALRVTRAMHSEFPFVTFDYTAKIEHLLKHRPAVRELRTLGCLFVVSAAESLSDRSLAALHKGHTRDDVFEAIRYFRELGLTLRPTFVPFTPWDALDDYCDLLDMVERENLIDNVDPVQYSIRLLIPPGSLLLRSPEMQPYLGALDQENFAYEWRHPDPRMDDLQKRVSRLVERATETDEDPAVTFFRIRGLAWREAVDERLAEPARRRFPADRPRPPRLTENWFC